MPDPRFYTTKTPLTNKDAAGIAGVAPPQATGEIQRAASLGERDLRNAVIFCADKQSIDRIGDRPVGMCLTTAKLAPDYNGPGVVLITPSPKLAFALISAHLHHSIEDEEQPSDKSAAHYGGANVHPTASVCADVEIGDGATIGPHCHIGHGVVIGAGANIGAGVTITHAKVGKNVSILPGARIGQAGFGFVEHEGAITRVPQLGRVIIDDHVEIGANTTIDRGALDDTVIGEGSKIDNLVQIGHNVRIGKYCILAAQTGISGSCIIEDGVLMGGQVGLADHLHIGAGVQLAAQAGLMRDVPAGERWGGSPARPIREWLRETTKLARMAKQKNGNKS